MPKFLDHHPPGPKMTPEQMQQGIQMMQQMKADIQAGKVDQHGVKALNVFTASNGEAWCLTDAPDVEAVIKAHAAKGANLTAADVAEVNALI